MEGQVGEEGQVIAGLWGSSGELSLGWGWEALVRGGWGKRGGGLRSGSRPLLPH